MRDWQGGAVLFRCDDCGDTLPADTLDLEHSVRLLLHAGWLNRYEFDRWHHYCPVCWSDFRHATEPPLPGFLYRPVGEDAYPTHLNRNVVRQHRGSGKPQTDMVGRVDKHPAAPQRPEPWSLAEARRFTWNIGKPGEAGLR